MDRFQYGVGALVSGAPSGLGSGDAEQGGDVAVDAPDLNFDRCA